MCNAQKAVPHTATPTTCTLLRRNKALAHIASHEQCMDKEAAPPTAQPTGAHLCGGGDANLVQHLTDEIICLLLLTLTLPGRQWKQTGINMATNVPPKGCL